MNIGKTRSILLMTLMLCVLVTACVESITMHSSEEMPVVVNCVLTRDSTQYLYLYYARKLDESEYKSITNAKVIVSESGRSYEFAWDGARWQSEFVPEYGTEYNLSVTLEDGRFVYAKTRFPEKMFIVGTPIYFASQNIFGGSECRYYTVIGCQDKAFIWLTGIKNNKGSVSNICTNHSGADNSNIVGGAWEDLPNSQKILKEYSDNPPEADSGEDPRIWNSYKNACLGLPFHKDYLRIRHDMNYASGSSAPLVQKDAVETPVPGGFILDADKHEYVYGATYMLPLRTYFLSEEYDIYLSNVVKAGLHQDELASMYSMDLNYTNIHGGIGIFGSAYWNDYVR